MAAVIPLTDVRAASTATARDAFVRDAANATGADGSLPLDTRRRPLSRPAHLGHRPLQLPLRLLHAEGCLRPRLPIPAARGAADVRGDRAHRCDLRPPGRAEDPPDRRRAAVAPQPRAPGRDAARSSGDVDLTLTTNGALLAKKARALRDAGLTRVTVSLDSLDDATFRAMNDVDFPVAARAGRHRRRARGRTRARQDQHGRQARHERAFDRADGARISGTAATSSGSSNTWTSGHTNGWRMDDVVPAAEIVGMIDREFPLEPIDPNYPGEVARALALPGRRRRDRRHRVGDAGVLPRLHARAPFHRRQALHVPFRRQRLRPARAAARRRTPTSSSATRSRRSGAARGDRYSEIRTANTPRESPDRDVVHRGIAMRYRPLADRCRATVDVRRDAPSTSTARCATSPIAGEHPLTLYVDKQEILTLMTLGAAPEALAIGYLRNQRLVRSPRRDRRRAGRLGDATRSPSRPATASPISKRRPRSARRPPAAARARCSAT